MGGAGASNDAEGSSVGGSPSGGGVTSQPPASAAASKANSFRLVRDGNGDMAGSFARARGGPGGVKWSGSSPVGGSAAASIAPDGGPRGSSQRSRIVAGDCC